MTQRDSTKEYNQLRPRSLRSNGTELDEVMGDMQDVSRPLAEAADAIGVQPIEMMSERGEKLAKKSGEQTPPYQRLETEGEHEE